MTNRAAPGRFTQPASKNLSTASKDWVKARKDPATVPDPSDDEPLSEQANEPKPKAHKRDTTPELVIVDDDDSTPLPGKQKTEEVTTSGGQGYRGTLPTFQRRGPGCPV